MQIRPSPRSLRAKACEKLGNGRGVISIRLAISNHNFLRTKALYEILGRPFALHDMVNIVNHQWFGLKQDLLKFRKVGAKNVHPMYLRRRVRWRGQGGTGTKRHHYVYGIILITYLGSKSGQFHSIPSIRRCTVHDIIASLRACSGGPGGGGSGRGLERNVIAASTE
jgi:hypothetical protein